jgi:uncharacterized membrane protein (UPF0127 family)
MNRRSRQYSLRLLCVVCLFTAQSPGATAQGMKSAGEYLASLPRERIAVETRSARRHLFEAWRAESYAARAQGLMFIKDSEMRPDQAMIFVYEPAQRVSMWMKNTLLSLDMLFVDSRGCVVTIHEQAEPGSQATIDSRVPVTLVVELRGGTVQEKGMRVGDSVRRLDRDAPREYPPCSAAHP